VIYSTSVIDNTISARCFDTQINGHTQNNITRPDLKERDYESSQSEEFYIAAESAPTYQSHWASDSAFDGLFMRY
jgi:hypothetical protein